MIQLLDGAAEEGGRERMVGKRVAGWIAEDAAPLDLRAAGPRDGAIGA